MRVSGKILTEAFGRLHIQNDAIALGEQIKNAIDAKANKIIFDFTKIYSEKTITIHENGVGLNAQEFKDEWNTLGDSSKRDKDDLLGGKGIGRFALFRISNDIDFYCKKAGEDAIYTKMLYDEIEGYNDISELEFSPIVINSDFWKENCEFDNGTFIKLNNIEKINLTYIQRELKSFNLPFQDEKIEIECKYPDNFSKRDFLVIEETVKCAPFNLTAVFDKGSFQKCKCLLRDIDGSEIKTEELNLETLNAYIQDNLEDDERDFNIDRNCLNDIGKVTVYIDNFFFESAYSKKANISAKIIQDRFLYSYQGINIYRNKVKIFGFGSNDFLKLAEERLKRSGDNIDNKNTFGYAIVDGGTKEKLIEQTNREGFVFNDYYKLLILILEITVSEIGVFRKQSKSIILGKTDPIDTKTPFLNIDKNLKLFSKEKNKSHILKQVHELVKKGIKTNLPLDDIDIQIDMSTYEETELVKQYLNVKISCIKNDNIKDYTTVEVIYNRASNQREKALLWMDKDLQEKLKKKNKKLFTLINEITNLNIYKYPNGCAFLLRSIIEISFNLFIRKYQGTYKLRVIYDDKKEEIVVRKDQNKLAKANDRVEGVIWIIRQLNASILTIGKAEFISDNIKKIDFTIHKNNNFIIPENLIAFYSDIEQILLYVLNDISKDE